MRYTVDELQPLLRRAKALPEVYRAYLDGHVKAAVEALETALELCESMAADKEAQTRMNGAARCAPLRLLPTSNEA